MSLHVSCDIAINNAFLYVDGNVAFHDGTASAVDSTIQATGSLSIAPNHQFIANGLANSHWLIGGNASFQGNGGNRKNLVADSEWTLAVGGGGTATYCDVAWSNAGGGNSIFATDGTNTDQGHNINWKFADYLIIEQAILYYLESLPSLAGVSIAPVRATRNSNFPLIIVTRVSGGHDYTLNASVTIASPVFQFTVCSKSFRQTTQIALELKKALQFFHGTWDTLPIFNCSVNDYSTSGVVRFTEPDAGKIYTQTVDATITHHEILAEFEDVELDDSWDIETAMRGYLKTLTDAPVEYDDLDKNAGFPAVVIDRLSTTMGQTLGNAWDHSEPRFQLHIYGRNYREVSQLAHDLWKGLHTFHGYWGDLFIGHVVVESIADQPIGEGADLDKGFFHKALTVYVWHREDLTA